MPRTSITEAEIREALLNAATESFLRDGIVGTEMKAIAERAGLSRSTLYRYAISRNQLAFLVAERQMRLISEAALAAPDELPRSGWERAVLFCENLLAVLEARPDVLRLMAEFDGIYAGPYPDIPEARDYVITIQRIHNAMTQVILDGMADHSITHVQDAGLFAAVMENTVFGLATRFVPRAEHYREEQRQDGHTIIAETVRRLLDGVCAGRD